MNYKRYNLKENPFPYVGVPNFGGHLVFVDRTVESETISECLAGSISGVSTNIVLVGGYGNGKTATLRYIKNELERYEFVFSIYLSNPGDTFRQLYNNLMHAIGLHTFENIVWKYLVNANGDPRIRQRIENGTVLISEVVEKSKKEIAKITDYTDFTNAFLQTIFEESRLISWRYLCGESIPSDQKRMIDLVSNIDSDEKAIRALITLKNIFHKIGISLLCIMIDELEYVESLISFKKQKMLNHMRRLIDLNPTGLSIIMGCAPESWNSIIQGYHAFSERISRQIVLPSISNKISKELIVSYLSQYRIAKTKDPLEPFTDDCPAKICSLANGNIRRVLAICNRLIDFGLKMDCDSITPSMINKIIQR